MKKKTNNLIRLIIFAIFSLITVFCFIYYTVKFSQYINQENIFWILFGIGIIVILAIGIFNSINILKLQKENAELKETIVNLMNLSESHYYSTLEYIQNSREISLDVLNELREKP